MSVLKPIVLSAAIASILVGSLAGCAPANPGGVGPAASNSSGTSPKPASGGASPLHLIDVCSKIPIAAVASLLGRPYAEVDNSTHTATASGCDYDGAGGVKSRLDLKVSMQAGASKSDVDKILANLAEDGENPVHIQGMGDYAGAVKDVVVALYGSTIIIAIDSNHPSGAADLTTAQLRQVVKTVVAAAS